MAGPLQIYEIPVDDYVGRVVALLKTQNGAEVYIMRNVNVMVGDVALSFPGRYFQDATPDGLFLAASGLYFAW